MLVPSPKFCIMLAGVIFANLASSCENIAYKMALDQMLESVRVLECLFSVGWTGVFTRDSELPLEILGSFLRLLRNRSGMCMRVGASLTAVCFPPHQLSLVVFPVSPFRWQDLPGWPSLICPASKARVACPFRNIYAGRERTRARKHRKQILDFFNSPSTQFFEKLDCLITMIAITKPVEDNSACH
jgi:hypothetical protein